MTTCENLATADQLTALAKKIDYQQNQIDGLAKDILGFGTQQAAIGAGLAKVVVDVIALGAVLLGLKNAGDNFSLNEQIQANKKSIQNLQDWNSSLDSGVNAANLKAEQAIEKAEFAIGETNFISAVSQAALSTANEATDKADKAIAETNKITSDFNSLSNSLGGDISTLNGKISNLEAETQQGKTAIQTILNLIDGFNSSIATLQGNIGVLDTEINQAIGLLDAQKNQIQTNKTDINSLLGQISFLQTAVSGFNSAISQIQSSLQGKADKSELSNLSGGGGGSVSQLSDQVAQLSDSVSSISSQVSTTNNQTTAAISNLQNQVTQNTATITTVFAPGSDTFSLTSGQIENLATKTEVAQVNDQISSLKGAIGAVSTNVSGVQNQTNNLKNTVTGLQTQVADIQQTQELEGETVQLQVSGLTSAIANTPALTAAAVAQALSPSLTNIQNQTTNTAITSAAAAGVCQTTQPGGCIANNVVNPINSNTNAAISGVGTGLSAANNALLQAQGAVLNTINATTQATNGVVNTINATVHHAQHGLQAVQNFAAKAWDFAQIDKVLNAMNLVVATHNASMLSQNVAQTIGDTASAALNLFNIKNPVTGEAIDVNQVIGQTVKSKIEALIGANALNTISETWLKLNRIHQAAAGMISSIQGTKNAILEIHEVTGGWTAKIGNGLQQQGIIEENTYPWMNPNPDFSTPYQGLLAKLDNVENFANSVNSVVQNALEIQQNTNELLNQKEQMTTALDSFSTQQTATETTETENSASPDIDRLDLIKLEEPANP